MDALNLDQVLDEIVPRGREPAPPPYTPVNGLTRQPGSEGDEAAAALGLVSEAAAAIRELERESAQAVARARNVANAVKEKLERAEVRADRAETALRLAESQVEELSAAVEQTRNELETLQSQLAAREAEVAVSLRRADDAEAALQRVVEAIRAQLPIKLNMPAE